MTPTGDTFDFQQGNVVTSSAQIVDSAATVGDVLTVQADKSISAAPGGGSQAVLLASVTLTSAQILDLAATPVAIIPDPGVGKAAMALSVWSSFKFGTVQYSGTGLFKLDPHYRGYSNFVASVADVIGKSFDAIQWWDQIQYQPTNNAGGLEYDHSDLAGDAWAIQQDYVLSPIADGDGELTVYATYVVFDLPT